jgi:hypothetical protein
VFEAFNRSSNIAAGNDPSFLRHQSIKRLKGYLKYTLVHDHRSMRDIPGKRLFRNPMESFTD